MAQLRRSTSKGSRAIESTCQKIKEFLPILVAHCYNSPMQLGKLLVASTLCLAVSGSFGQGDKPPIRSAPKPGQRPTISPGQSVIAVRDSLVARPKTGTPVAAANGRPGKQDDTPFLATVGISWRSNSPTAEFKLNGPGPYPKTGTFEVYEFAPAPVTGSTGLTVFKSNQIQVLPIAPIHKQKVTTDAEGKFTVNFGGFAPKAPTKIFDKFGIAPGAAAGDESSKNGNLAAGKIQGLGYTNYYVRVVNDNGTSSTNALIEYGEVLPPETQSFAEVQIVAGGAWSIGITSSVPVYHMRWSSQARGATAAVFQLSTKPFPDDARTWRLSSFAGMSGPAPAGAAGGINDYSVDLKNYIPHVPHGTIKGTFYYRVIPLRSNGDMAAQPSSTVTLTVVDPPPPPAYPPTKFEIWVNSLYSTGETAEKPIWGDSAQLNFVAKMSFRWSTQTGISKAKFVVERYNSFGYDPVFDTVIDHQGNYDLPIGPNMMVPGIYQITLTPIDASGKQVAQSAKVFNTVPVPSVNPGLPANKNPPSPSANFNVTVDHYQPPVGETLYHFILAKDPPQGNLYDDAMYKFYAGLVGHTPHKGDKIYLPPKPDNGKSWSDVVSDGVNFVAGIIKWAEGVIASLNSFYVDIKNAAAEGIASATGLPASVIRMGIDIAMEAMGVPSTPLDFPGMSELGSDFVAGEILDAVDVPGVDRDALAGKIKSGISDMAQAGKATNNPNAPMLIPDPDYADKPAMMKLRINCTSSDPNVYGHASPISIRVESWGADGNDHIVLYENTVILPKLKAGQTVVIPVALKYYKTDTSGPTHENALGRWNKAMYNPASTWFTVGGEKITNHLSSKAWP